MGKNEAARCASHFSEIEKGMSERARRRVDIVLKSFARLPLTATAVLLLLIPLRTYALWRYKKLRGRAQRSCSPQRTTILFLQNEMGLKIVTHRL